MKTNIPTIGGTRGVFEIFVPGAFLLLNLAAVVYLLPFIDEDTKSFISGPISNPVLGLVIILCFGYLIGVILRLFTAEPVDKLSAKWIRMTKPYARQKLWVDERFPYIGWIGEVCKSHPPPDTIEFYYNTWASRKHEGRNTHFFNFCKTIITRFSVKRKSQPKRCHAGMTRSTIFKRLFFNRVVIIGDSTCVL